jgi:toxin-antitoxin system PIN domain toxin
VIALDTNVLVYAHRVDSPFHARAAERVRDVAEGSASWAIPWPCIHEFFAIVTHARIYSPPSPIGKALAQLDAWLESPSLVLLSENDVYWPALRRSLESAHVQGPRTHDARIAALCIAHGISELWSADRDFSRFGELRVSNPLVA